MSEIIRLGLPTISNIIYYSADTVVIANSIVLSIIYSNQFDLSVQIIQKILAYLIVDGILFLLNTYQLILWFYNMNKTFASETEIMYWKADNFYPKTELILSIISLIIRLAFLDITWKSAPAGFGLYTAIYVVSIYTYAKLFIFVIIVLLGLSLAVYYRQSPFPENRYLRRNYIISFIPLNLFRSSEDCPICLENPDNMTWTQLQCSHKFHIDCMRKYTFNLAGDQYPTCPICRSNIVEISQV